MKEIDNSIEEFMTSFDKMFGEVKYNLKSLNNRLELMDKCFNNIMLLKSDKPFEENGEDQKQDIIILDSDENDGNLKITSKEMDEIEKMFLEMDRPKKMNNNFINKKRKYNSKNKNKNRRSKKEDDGPVVIPHLDPERKIEKYTKFKEMKNNIIKQYKGKISHISDYEDEIDDDFDLDML